MGRGFRNTVWVVTRDYLVSQQPMWNVANQESFLENQYSRLTLGASYGGKALSGANQNSRLWGGMQVSHTACTNSLDRMNLLISMTMRTLRKSESPDANLVQGLYRAAGRPSMHRYYIHINSKCDFVIISPCSIDTGN